MKSDKISLLKKARNRLKLLMLMILSVGLIVTNVQIPVQAVTHQVKEEFPSEIQNWHRLKGTGIPAFLTIDGEVAWCIEPGKTAQVGSNTEYTFEGIGYTRELGKKLAYIAYFGYRVNPTYDNYVLTQNLIWETIGTKAGNDFYFYVSSRYPTRASQKAWQDSVMAQVNSMDTVPSFNGGNYTLNVGQSLEIEDSNGVLQYFAITSTSGLNVSKNGNKLTITATSESNENSIVTLVRDIPQTALGGLFAVKNMASDSQAVSTVKINDPALAVLNITVNKYGSLNIAKKDDRGTLVPNTSFKISYNADMSDPIGTYTTGNDGTVTINELLPQTVYVQEVSVPDHLILDSTIRSITIVPNETVYFSATNNWKQGKIQVVKKDSETGETVKKAGTQFDILNGNNEVVATITTNSEGVAISDFLDYGTYTVKEKTAPNGYIVNVTESNPIAVIENNQTYTVDISNTRVKGSIEFTKEFADTETGLTGDSILEGVTYELHAHENILNPADGSVLYAKDSVIPNTSKQTDVEGKITWTNLYLGSYDVHEVISNGTVVVNTVDVQADLNYADQNTSNVSVSVTHKDKPNEQAYSLIKIGSNGETGEVPALEGAEFTAKLKSDVDELGWENAPTYDVSVTDSKGYLESQRLPYGVYIVRETKKPDEHEAVEDFIITITEDSTDPQVWRIMNDAPFEGILKLIKKDAETGKMVLLPNTTFKIKNTDTGEYLSQFVWFPLPHTVDTWSTTDQGMVYLNNVVMYGNYQLEEITAPNGYVLNTEPVKFTVSENGVYEVGEDGITPVITVEMEDISVKGQITVYKQGEVFSGVHQNEDGSYSFDYELKGQSDTEFNLIADDDIYDPSNDGTILYEKDEVVESIITDESGIAVSSELPLGNYRVEEIKVQDGMILNTEIQKVTLAYENQTVEVVSEEISFTNDRQKVSIELTKKDKDDHVLSGAVYGLYTKTDLILDDEVLLEADTLIEKAITDENGKLSFNADLPISLDNDVHFYVKEIEAPYGFVLSDEVFDLDTKFAPQTETVINNQISAVDDLDVGYLEFLKTGEVFTHTDTWQTEFGMVETPVFEEKTLLGAEITIYADEDIILGGHTYYAKDEVVQVLESQWEAVTSKELPAGKYYYTETKTPLGYVTDTEKHYFEIKADGNKESYVVESTLKNILPSYQLDFTKLMEENYIKDNEAYRGVIFGLYARDEISDYLGNVALNADTLVATLGIDEDGHFVNVPRLPVGNYYLKELSTNGAYVLDENEYDFSVEATHDEEVIVSVNHGEAIVNELKDYTVTVQKVDEETQEAITDKPMKFAVYLDSDCTNLLKEVMADTETGKIVFDGLHVGEYWIKEVEAPEGYDRSDEVLHVMISDDEITVNDTVVEADEMSNVEITFSNLKTKIPETPKTSDDSDITTWMGVSGISMILICSLILLKGKKRKGAEA